MSKILIAVLIFSFTASAQLHNRNFADIGRKVQSDIISFQIGDSLYKSYYLFRVPYNSLVFEKDNSKFISKLEVAIEIKNGIGEVVERKFLNENIVLDDFERTISDVHFIANLIESELIPDTFQYKITYNDLIAGKPFEVNQKKIDLVRTKDLPRWLVVNHKDSNPSNNFEIEILDNIIPYSPYKYDLLISGNFDFSEVEKIQIKSEDTVLSNIEFENYNSVFPKIMSDNNRLLIELISNKEDNKEINYESFFKTNFLLIKKINEHLFEGKYFIRLLKKNEELLTEFSIPVKWLNKPKSLFDYNLALELIEYIETDESYRSYFSSNSEKMKKLFDYWKQKDPTPNTSFNELMNEYYLRADYAQKEFISISQRNGAKTDRGKIFILNGRPERTERSVNSDGKVIETWYYEKPKRVFSFVDFRGDGSFKIVE